MNPTVVGSPTKAKESIPSTLSSIIGISIESVSRNGSPINVTSSLSTNCNSTFLYVSPLFKLSTVTCCLSIESNELDLNIGSS